MKHIKGYEFYFSGCRFIIFFTLARMQIFFASLILRWVIRQTRRNVVWHCFWRFGAFIFCKLILHFQQRFSMLTFNIFSLSQTQKNILRLVQMSSIKQIKLITQTVVLFIAVGIKILFTMLRKMKWRLYLIKIAFYIHFVRNLILF